MVNGKVKVGHAKDFFDATQDVVTVHVAMPYDEKFGLFDVIIWHQNTWIVLFKGFSFRGMTCIYG